MADHVNDMLDLVMLAATFKQRNCGFPVHFCTLESAMIIFAQSFPEMKTS